MVHTVVAGAALSLSGRFAVQGEQARRGLALWVEHVNGDGGLRVEPGEPKHPVVLRVYDDASRRAGAAEATERLLVQDRVELLFSPYSSVLAIAAAEVAERYGRLLWNHGGSSDALEARGWRHVVTMLTPASRYFVPVLDMAVHHGGAHGRRVETVALLHGASGTFPQAVISGARTRARSLSLTIVLDEPYPALSPRPDPLPSPTHGSAAGGEGPLPRLARLEPDLILGVGTTEADLAFAVALRRHRIRPCLVGLVAAPIEHFQVALGQDADGFCGPSQWEPILQDQPELGPTSTQFCADFRARFGLEPDYPAAQAYAAGLIAAHCARVAGSLADDALQRAAASLDLTTFYGRFRLDPQSGQQIGHQMVVAQWQGGRRQIVWPSAVATASPQFPLPAPAPTASAPDARPSS